MLDQEITAKIETLLKQSDVMLFMKGNKAQPMCGFSAQVVNLLNKNKTSYETFDILADWDIREGLKEYSHWPTFPQLYVKGELIGGCDIVMDLDRKGELAKILNG
jgi:monothiol glutaredoxin